MLSMLIFNMLLFNLGILRLSNHGAGRLCMLLYSTLNDFVQQLDILYGAFPSVFPLREGCGFENGPLSLSVRQFLLRHFSRRPACNNRLLMSRSCCWSCSHISTTHTSQ